MLFRSSTNFFCYKVKGAERKNKKEKRKKHKFTTLHGPSSHRVHNEEVWGVGWKGAMDLENYVGESI